MNKTKSRILVLLFALLIAGCQSDTPSAESTVPITETVQQTEPPTVPIAETEETAPGVEQYQAYQWLVNLKAEDVAFVEFINLNDSQTPYRRYEGDEIQEVIDLFQAKRCMEYMPSHPVYEYAPVIQWQGYYNSEFHVIMKDGTAHTVCSVYSVAVVIDGTGFHTISDWLNHHWPESGNAPLPENWLQEVSTRNYHTANCVSTLSTTTYESDRDYLDHSYNTQVEFGSRSRNYPIGRGGVELSASDASTEGVSLSAYCFGTGIITQFRVQPQYWLEKWQEDTEIYSPLDGGEFHSEAPQELLPDAARHWYISWKNACGTLEPGHYRVGMIIYEEFNGQIRNETICYAKFSISE